MLRHAAHLNPRVRQRAAVDLIARNLPGNGARHGQRAGQRDSAGQRGCRTELVAEVDDANRLLDTWGGGVLGASASDYYASLHRVCYYGDHEQSISQLAQLMGLSVAQEG